MNYSLMSKATSIQLIKNTYLTFRQIANFCELHTLEIQSIADGEVAKEIKALNLIIRDQVTIKEIKRCENDMNASISLSSATIELIKKTAIVKKENIS